MTLLICMLLSFCAGLVLGAWWAGGDHDDWSPRE